MYDSLAPMRFCPFCGAENADDSAQCAVCARKLPAPVVRKPTTLGDAAVTPAPLPAPPAPAPRAASASIPPPLPPAAAAATPRAPSAVTPTPPPAPPSPSDRAASVPPNGKNGNLGLPPPPVDRELLRETGRAADGSRPLPTPTPSQRYGRDATESALATRELQLPEIEEARKALTPMPVVPDSGLYDAAKYAVQFVQARWQRRKAIQALGADVVKETASLDGVLGELGKAARAVELDGKVFADENNAITEAERRRTFAEQACEDLTAKKAEENAKFETVQKDLTARLAEREAIFAEIAAELGRLEAQRRGLRDKKKEIEKRLRAVVKSAEEREEAAAKSQMGEARQGLREGASDFRREARQIEDEKTDIESRLAGLEKPLGDVSTRHDQARADVELSRKDLENAREGHRHRTAEIEAETARRFAELRQSESEIARRLVTLGTIVNLNRVEKAEFMPLFERADQLRALISARETEAERLAAEQHAYDRPALIRGSLVLVGALIVLSVVIWLVKWLVTRG